MATYKRIPKIGKLGNTRESNRSFSKGGKKPSRKYACGGKMKK
jgi:hypothetical protein